MYLFPFCRGLIERGGGSWTGLQKGYIRFCSRSHTTTSHNLYLTLSCSLSIKFYSILTIPYYTLKMLFKLENSDVIPDMYIKNIKIFKIT